MSINDFDVQKMGMYNIRKNPSPYTTMRKTSSSLLSPQDPQVLSSLLVNHRPPITLGGVYSKCQMTRGEEMPVDRDIHKVLERQRRKDMKIRFSVLRSLLPQEYLMGRRSVSDQVQGAVEYIHELQEQVKKLAEKRDDMRISVRSHVGEKACNTMRLVGGSKPLKSFPEVKITPVGSSIEISIGIFVHQILLSDVLHVLENHGLDIVNVNAYTIEDKVFHTIYAKVSEHESFDKTSLFQKIWYLVMQTMAITA